MSYFFVGEYMKKIVFFGIIFFVVFLIYYFNADKKIYYLSMGDYVSYGINNFEDNNDGYSKYIKEYYGTNLKKYVNYSSLDDYRVMDLINDINYNKEVLYKGKAYKLQNLLIKANLITLSIGMNDIIYKNNIDYDYVDDLIDDIDNLFKILRKYNKDKICFLGFYDVINNPDLITYTNKKIESICIKHKIKYVDISNLNSYIIKGIYPTNDGYRYISDRVLNFTK